MNADELNQLVSAFIAHYANPVVMDQEMVLLRRDNSATAWAVDQVVDMGLDAPETLWDFVLEVLRRNPPTEVIGILAAGPLEEFLACCGESVIAKVEAQAASDERFRSLLGGVWQNRMSDAVWTRVCACRDASEWC
jgi:hypothetical protein